MPKNCKIRCLQTSMAYSCHMRLAWTSGWRRDYSKCDEIFNRHTRASKKKFGLEYNLNILHMKAAKKQLYRREWWNTHRRRLCFSIYNIHFRFLPEIRNNVHSKASQKKVHWVMKNQDQRRQKWKWINKRRTAGKAIEKHEQTRFHAVAVVGYMTHDRWGGRPVCPAGKQAYWT